MNIELLVVQSVPALSPDDTIYRALELLEENKLNALPIVADEEYIATVTENSLLEFPDDSITLSQTGLLQYKPAISSLAHPFDAINMMQETALAILPVIDFEQHKYIGCVTRETLLGYIAGYTGINNPGGIIVLEIPPRNYSMFEIARLCENEDVIILNMQSRTNERAMLEVSLKLNRTVLDAVVSSFERHGYHVLEVYGKESDHEDIASKYNQLMNYINM